MDTGQCQNVQPHEPHVFEVGALFVSCPGVLRDTAQAAADRLYPPNHPVDDPEGETGEAQSDPYGYDELANRAFVEGAAWQAEQMREAVLAIRQGLSVVDAALAPLGSVEAEEL